MSDFIQVVTTVEHEEDGARLAHLAVGEGLAACVQIAGPILSVYRWQGEIEQANEYQVVLKSRMALFAQLEKLLVASHPYDVPEIIATPLVACGALYEQWLEDALPHG